MKRSRLLSKLRFKFADALGVDAARKKQLTIELSKSATLKDLVYWMQIFFSAGIATLGLVLNSPAVIIGAMLISPLMGPILSLGLALATGDLVLGIRAVINLTLSCLAAIGFAVFLVALLPFKEMTPEIAGRIAPNTLDLFVALFSGAIGSIATCREVRGVVTSIPGVAIAVALMPPLGVVGYGIGLALSFNFSDGINTALGGGLLFLTNLFAITFTAMVVFLLLRIDTGNIRKSLEEWRRTEGENAVIERLIKQIPVIENARSVRSLTLRLLMILIPLLVIIFPLSSSFSKLKNEISQQQDENKIKQTALNLWQEKFEKTTSGEIRSFVDSLSISENKGKISVLLRIFDNEAYAEAEKKEYIKLLAEQLSSPPESIDFQLIEIPTSRRDKPIFEEKPKEISLAQLHANFLQKAKAAMTNLPFPVNAKLIDYKFISRQTNALDLQISYISENEMSEDAKDLIRQNVRQKLQIPTANTEMVYISNKSILLPFIGNTAQLSETKELANVAQTLRQYENLRLNISLRKIDGNGPEILENRQKTITDFFAANYNINSDRINWTEGETDSQMALVAP